MKRLWALKDFFDRYPEYRGKFTFLQVAIPTRNNVEAYRQYRDLIRKTVTEINERFEAPPEEKSKGWKPIEYIEGRVTPSHTRGLLQDGRPHTCQFGVRRDEPCGQGVCGFAGRWDRCTWW